MRDMFTLDVDIYVCPTNGVGVMGKGLAKQFADRFPGLLAEYQNACKAGAQEPGRLFLWVIPEGEFAGRMVCCLPTKRHWRDDSRLDDVLAGAQMLEAWMRDHPGHTAAIPPLGCGTGRLAWSEVGPLLRYQFEHVGALFTEDL